MGRVLFSMVSLSKADRVMVVVVGSVVSNLFTIQGDGVLQQRGGEGGREIFQVWLLGINKSSSSTMFPLSPGVKGM